MNRPSHVALLACLLASTSCAADTRARRHGLVSGRMLEILKAYIGYGNQAGFSKETYERFFLKNSHLLSHPIKGMRFRPVREGPMDFGDGVSSQILIHTWCKPYGLIGYADGHIETTEDKALFDYVTGKGTGHVVRHFMSWKTKKGWQHRTVEADRPPRSAAHRGLLVRLADLETRYGNEVKEEPYRPDLYPPSHVFEGDDSRITAAFMGGKCVRLDIFYQAAPKTRDLSALLRLHGGPGPWERTSNSDPLFAKHFPAFAPGDERNELFATKGRDAVVLAQRKVGLGELVLWFQCRDYPRRLKAYRSRRARTPSGRDGK